MLRDGSSATSGCRIAGDERLPLDELARYQPAGRAWIAALGDDGLVAGWAAARRAPALTLTTFANVPR